jgi:hypothetical protein
VGNAGTAGAAAQRKAFDAAFGQLFLGCLEQCRPQVAVMIAACVGSTPGHGETSFNLTPH